jgi:hypothetical protein
MFDIHRLPKDRDGFFDPDNVYRYSEALMREFAQSPEGKRLIDAKVDLAPVSWLAEYSLNHLGIGPAEMTLGDFNEVIFELIPAKVSTPADSADWIVRVVKAFWEFAGRNYGLTNAAPILATLDERAVKRLHRQLSDPSNFGMAKSFVMAGMEEGYDMSTEEGINEFMRVYNASLGSPLQSELPVVIEEARKDDSPTLPGWRSQTDERRKARKRQRQARKKNRR